MEITVTEKTDGKYPSIQAGGKKYNVSAELFSQLQIGQTYKAILKDRTITSKKDGKTYTFQDIIAVQEPESGQNGASGSLKSDSEAIKQNLEAKNLAIKVANERNARGTALEAALSMVTAYGSALESADTFKSLNEAEIKNYLISMKKQQYAENCKLVGVEPEIEF